MRTELIQEMGIFDPRTLPAYIQEITKWRRVMGMPDATVSGGNFPPLADILRLKEYELEKDHGPTLSEGPVTARLLAPNSQEMILLSEVDPIKDGRYVGEALYPSLLAYLQPLGISTIYDLRDLQHHKEIRTRIRDLEGLRSNLAAFYATWLEFKAIINPSVGLGTNQVVVEMDWSSNENLEEESRSIGISARFTNPQSARIGLKGLEALYPEMTFEERLFAVELPEQVRIMYRKAINYQNLHFAYLHGLRAKKPEGEFDPAVYQSFKKEAMQAHLRFLLPLWEELGLVISEASYYDDRANLDYHIQISTLRDVMEIIAGSSFNQPRIPNLSAEFNGRKVRINMSLLHGDQMQGIGDFDFAMIIENQDQEGTLEDILEGVQRI